MQIVKVNLIFCSVSLSTILPTWHKGVPVGDQLISILLDADDVVLLAENEHDLQRMLDRLNDWCLANRMSVNASKSNVVHFRPISVTRTIF